MLKMIREHSGDRSMLPKSMLPKVLLLNGLLAFALSAAAQANDPSATIKSAVETWLDGRYKVEEVRKTPIAGMYEVRIAPTLFTSMKKRSSDSLKAIWWI